MPPYFIGIAGPSGSGKTTLANALAERLSGTSLIPMDCYYQRLQSLDVAARKTCNFDDPALIDWDLLIAHINALYQEKEIQRPIYCFESYSRLAETIPVQPSAFVIIEGIFALHSEELHGFLNAKIFVTAPDDICFRRRLDRDTNERGRTAESVIKQYETTVRPSALRFVLPTRDKADLILRGDQLLSDSLFAALGLIENTATALQF